MGYSHYWRMDKDLELTEDQGILIDYVLEEHKDLIDQTGAPDFTTENHTIFLNGIGELNHETFAVTKKAEEFDFCKTARKPYDIVVCKLLFILSQSPGFSFSSDGLWREDGVLVLDGKWLEASEWMNTQSFNGKEILEAQIPKEG